MEVHWQFYSHIISVSFFARLGDRTGGFGVQSAASPRLPTGFWTVLWLFAALQMSFLLAISSVGAQDGEEQAAHYGRLLERGVNLASALEAPNEGAWGVTLKPEYFQTIKEAGFQSVRIPIRWSAHAMPNAPYTISPEFFARIDWAVDQALSRKMSVVIDMHHYVDLYKNPEKEFPRLLAFWGQIASHYRSFPETLFFELVNEPFDQLTDERWQAMVPELLRTIRKTNPDRMVVIGPGYWNSISHLDQLHLPDSDRRLIVNFHYYVPMQFTHQGATWVKGADQWKDVNWTGTPKERQTLKEDFDKAAAWGRDSQRPLYLGEFGTFQTADMDSRARWTSAVAREAEAHGISWAYWDFCSTFGAYDSKANAWREPLLRALLPK